MKRTIAFRKQQIKLIENLLQQLIKTRTKCETLASQIGQQLQDIQRYKIMERTVKIKCDVLDEQGLIKLKNDLVRSVDKLIEVKRQYEYKKQRLSLSKQIQNKKQKRMQNSINKKVFSQEYVNPIYTPKQQSTQQKIDRLSKFIGYFKKHMKSNIDINTINRTKLRQYLFEYPQFQRQKQQLQKYMMREQQLSYIIEKTIKQQISKYLIKNSYFDEQKTHYLLKIPKSKYKNNHKKLQPPQKQIQKLHGEIQTKKQQHIQLQISFQNLSFQKFIQTTLQQTNQISNRLKQLSKQSSSIFQSNKSFWEQFQN